MITLNTDNLPEKQQEHVPIAQKVTLTIQEAAEYSNIGINRIDNLLTGALQSLPKWLCKYWASSENIKAGQSSLKLSRRIGII